jgi:hypothetical protein
MQPAVRSQSLLLTAHYLLPTLFERGQSAKVNETFPENLENAAIFPLKNH